MILVGQEWTERAGSQMTIQLDIVKPQTVAGYVIRAVDPKCTITRVNTSKDILLGGWTVTGHGVAYRVKQARELGRCYRCMRKRTKHWLCDRCEAFVKSLVGKPVRVLPGADAALDTTCELGYCDRACGPQEGRICVVEMAHTSNIMAPFVSFGDGGAPCEYVEVLVPAREQWV